MPYRTMPEPKAPAPPRKWPYRLALACATFVGITCGFMLLVDFGAHVDGPGVGYGSGVVGALLVGALGGGAGSIVLGVTWPWARAIGWPSGIALSIAFVALQMPAHLLQVCWTSSCDHGEGAACHGLGDERRGCTGGYWPSCDRLLEGTEGDRDQACASLVLPCSNGTSPREVCEHAALRCSR